MKLEGRKIVRVRHLTKQEMDATGWDWIDGDVVALELDNGTLIYASQDEEGNGPGAFFMQQNGGVFSF